MKKKIFKRATFDIYNEQSIYCGKKKHADSPDCKYVNDWLKNFKEATKVALAKLCFVGNDFQNQAKVQICSQNKKITLRTQNIGTKNLAKSL